MAVKKRAKKNISLETAGLNTPQIQTNTAATRFIFPFNYTGGILIALTIHVKKMFYVYWNNS